MHDLYPWSVIGYHRREEREHRKYLAVLTIVYSAPSTLCQYIIRLRHLFPHKPPPQLYLLRVWASCFHYYQICDLRKIQYLDWDSGFDPGAAVGLLNSKNR